MVESLHVFHTLLVLTILKLTRVENAITRSTKSLPSRPEAPPNSGAFMPNVEFGKALTPSSTTNAFVEALPLTPFPRYFSAWSSLDAAMPRLLTFVTLFFAEDGRRNGLFAIVGTLENGKDCGT